MTVRSSATSHQLLYNLVDQTISPENCCTCQSGEFCSAIFGDFITAADARSIYQDWRRRPTIELYYRFAQEDGLDVDKIQLHKLERIRREFMLILVRSLFVLRLPDLWHPSLILWFRRLSSATAGSDYDWGGPHLFLYGIQRVLSAWSVLLAAFKLLSDLLPKIARVNAITFG